MREREGERGREGRMERKLGGKRRGGSKAVREIPYSIHVGA